MAKGFIMMPPPGDMENEVPQVQQKVDQPEVIPQDAQDVNYPLRGYFGNAAASFKDDSKNVEQKIKEKAPASEVKQEEPSMLKELGMKVVRPLGTAISKLAELPKKALDYRDYLGHEAKQGIRAAAGFPPLGERPSYEELQKDNKHGILNPRKFAPTEKQWKGAIEKLVGESIAPASDNEETAARLIETITPWLAGGSVKAALLPLSLGEGARQAAGWFGAEEKGKNRSELFGQIVGSLLGNTNSFGKIVADTYSKRDVSKGAQAIADFTPLYKDTKGFISKLKKNAKGSSERMGFKRAALEKAEELIDTAGSKNFELVKSSKGRGLRAKAKVQDIADFKRTVNDLAAKNPEMYGLSKILNEGIKEGTSKLFPEWYDLHTLADKLHGMKAERTILGELVAKNETLRKITDNPYTKHLLGTAVGSGIVHHGILAKLPPMAVTGRVLAGAGAAVVAGKVHKAIDMIVRHPEVAELFLNTYKHGLLGETGKVISDITNLNKAVGFVSDSAKKGFIMMPPPV